MVLRRKVPEIATVLSLAHGTIDGYRKNANWKLLNSVSMLAQELCEELIEQAATDELAVVEAWRKRAS